MPLSANDLEGIIQRCAFHELVGQVENDVLDCKKQPYKVAEDAGKRELAKDVVAFANNQGGYVIIGIRTAKSTTSFGDEVVDLHPLDRDLVNTDQYGSIVRSWVFPDVQGLSIEWIPSAPADAAKGFVVVRVPPQKASAKPFLIKRVIDGAKVVETLFGYAERKGDKNLPLTVEELHKYLNLGLSYERTIDERFAAIELLLANVLAARQQDTMRKHSTELAQQRIEHVLDFGTLRGNPALVLAAVPEPSMSLRSIWLKTNGSIRRLLENPPDSRDAGWNMQTLDSPRIEAGECIRVSNGTVKVIDLYRDGMLVLAAAADEQYLGWGRHHDGTINSIALVESVLSFTEFYNHVLNDAQEQPSSIVFRAEFYSMAGDPPRILRPYGPNSFLREAHIAPNHTMHKTVKVPSSNFRSDELAFGILSEIYLWFGIEPEKIPGYVLKEGRGRVDKSLLLKQ
ncbi:MAG: hypothetical protein JWR16_1433 [Nevskia sp.]|nr:hypothetical protein [Nevskia sp.]